MNWSKFLFSEKHPVLSGLWAGVVIVVVGTIFSEGLISITDKLLHAAKSFCQG